MHFVAARPRHHNPITCTAVGGIASRDRPLPRLATAVPPPPPTRPPETPMPPASLPQATAPIFAKHRPRDALEPSLRHFTPCGLPRAPSRATRRLRADPRPIGHHASAYTASGTIATRAALCHMFGESHVSVWDPGVVAAHDPPPPGPGALAPCCAGLCRVASRPGRLRFRASDAQMLVACGTPLLATIAPIRSLTAPTRSDIASQSRSM